MYNKTKVIAGISAGVIGVAGILFGLGTLIASENNNDCEVIGLKGSIGGCKVDDRYVYDRIVIITGNTANSPKPEISRTAEKYIYNSLFKNRKNENFKINIYSASPSMPKITSPRIELVENDDDLASITNSYKDYKEQLNLAISTDPTEDGVNYYDSIIRFGKSLSKNNDDHEKTLLLVIGSGLSDCGTLDFSATTTDTLAMSTNDIIKKINEVNKISDDALEGVSIVWSFAGQASAPQADLSDSQATSLKNIYETVFDRMGAKKIIFDESDNSNRKSIDTNHKVAPMQVSNTSLDWGTKEFKENSSISFMGNDDILLNPEAAKAELAPLAEELKGNHSKVVNIVSYQAKLCKDDNGINSDLLARRANRIQKILEEMGVNSSQIKASSGGYGGSTQCEDPNDRRVTISVNKEK